MTPNQITVARVTAAFVAVAFFTCFRHSVAADLVAVALTVMAIALDGVDGYVARTRGLATPLGAQVAVFYARALRPALSLPPTDPHRTRLALQRLTPRSPLSLRRCTLLREQLDSATLNSSARDSSSPARLQTRSPRAGHLPDAASPTRAGNDRDTGKQLGW